MLAAIAWWIAHLPRISVVLGRALCVGIVYAVTRMVTGRRRRALGAVVWFFGASGGAWGKLGQILAGYDELLSPEACARLGTLRSGGRPLPPRIVDEILARELGQPRSVVFAAFEPAPLSVGVLGQVHAAQLPDGRRVIVKVQRPGIARTMMTDLRILRAALQVVDIFRPAATRLFAEIVADLARTISVELDYRNDALTLQALRRSSRRLPGIRTPRPELALSTRHVLVTGVMPGEPIDVAPISADAAHAIHAWQLHHVVEEGVCHERLHAGAFNLADDGRVLVVDPGVATPIGRDLGGQLYRLMRQLADRDVDRAIDALAALREQPAPLPFAVDGSVRRVLEGWLADRSARGHRQPGARLPDAAGAMLVALELVPDAAPAAIRAARALSALEALLPRLCPDFDVAESLRSWLALDGYRRRSPASLVDRADRLGSEYAQLVATLPARIDEAVAALRVARRDTGFLEQFPARAGTFAIELLGLTAIALPWVYPASGLPAPLMVSAGGVLVASGIVAALRRANRPDRIDRIVAIDRAA